MQTVPPILLVIRESVSAPATVERMPFVRQRITKRCANAHLDFMEMQQENVNVSVQIYNAVTRLTFISENNI